MNLEKVKSCDVSRPLDRPLDQVVEDLSKRREEQLKRQSSEIEIQAGELKHAVDQLGKEKWFQNLCAVLKANNEVVICSHAFLNRGYPHRGQCFFVATGEGLRVGFEVHSFLWPASHHHFKWPELWPGEALPIRQRIAPVFNPESYRWGTLSIRHRAPTSLMGLRRFDYRFAAEGDVKIGEIQEHLTQAVNRLQDRYGA